jgi:hypothetical protein
VFTIFLHDIVRGSEEADVLHVKAGFFQDLSRRAFFWRLAELEVTSRKSVSAGAVRTESLADEESWVVRILLRGGRNDECTNPDADLVCHGCEVQCSCREIVQAVRDCEMEIVRRKARLATDLTISALIRRRFWERILVLECSFRVPAMQW